MLITLASLTLAAILTAILLSWTLVKARRSLVLAAMTLLMLGMTWRGEAWKAGCLSAESQLSQLPPQCRQSLPKTGFSGRGSDFPYAGRRFADVEFQRTLVSSVQKQFASMCHPEFGGEFPQKIRITPAILELRGETVSREWRPLPWSKTGSDLPQQGDLIRTALEKPYRIGGNTVYWDSALDTSAATTFSIRLPLHRPIVSGRPMKKSGGWGGN